MHVCHFGFNEVFDQQNGSCTRREDEPTIFCIPLPGLVQRAREHAVQPLYRRTRPCLWVAESQELLDHGGKVFDHFRKEMKCWYVMFSGGNRALRSFRYRHGDVSVQCPHSHIAQQVTIRRQHMHPVQNMERDERNVHKARRQKSKQ